MVKVGVPLSQWNAGMAVLKRFASMKRGLDGVRDLMRGMWCRARWVAIKIMITIWGMGWSGPQLFRTREHLTPATSARPVASRQRAPGSGTATIERSGRAEAVPKLRESKR